MSLMDLYKFVERFGQVTHFSLFSPENAESLYAVKVGGYEISMFTFRDGFELDLYKRHVFNLVVTSSADYSDHIPSLEVSKNSKYDEEDVFKEISKYLDEETAV